MSGKSLTWLWLKRDPSAWPVIGVCCFGVAWCTYVSTKFLVSNPDVRLARDRRLFEVVREHRPEQDRWAERSNFWRPTNAENVRNLTFFSWGWRSNQNEISRA